MSVEHSFPNLKADRYQVTSPQSLENNCIAWAAGDDAQWWSIWKTGPKWMLMWRTTTRNLSSDVLLHSRWANDADAQAFLREADALIEQR